MRHDTNTIETKKDGTYITVSEYAKRYMLTIQAVHARIKAGTLKAKKIGSIYLVRV